MNGYQWTELERERYRYMHENGYEALRAKIGGLQAHYLAERWVDNRVARLNRVTWDYATFKKYAA